MGEIIFDKVTKRYDNVVIDNISHTFNLNESVAFVGRNGCGKSTMLKLIAGLMRPTFGKISCTSKLKIRYVPDKFKPVKMTAEEYIKSMCLIDGISRINIDKIINKWSERFFISDVMSQKMNFLSKGTLQKIAVIQAIMEYTDVLILDEPLSGQDIESQKVFIDIISELRTDGTSVFLSSHEPDLIELITDTSYKIIDGKMYKLCKEKHENYIIIFQKLATSADGGKEIRDSIVVNEFELQGKLMEMLSQGIIINGVYKNVSHDYL